APSPASSRARSVLRTSSSNLLSLLPPADHPVPLRVAAPAGGRTPEAGAVTAWRDRELPPARPRHLTASPGRPYTPGRRSRSRSTSGRAAAWGMTRAREVTVRGVPVRLLSGGAGPALLFLHSAGGAPPEVARADRSGRHQGRRLDLPLPVRDGPARARVDRVPRRDGGAGARPRRRGAGHAPGARPRAGGARPRGLEPVPLRPAPPPPASPRHDAHAALLGRARPGCVAR